MFLTQNSGHERINRRRIFDIVLSLLLLLIFALPLVAIAIGVKLSSAGPILHWSWRVGRFNRIFRMPKFRTMRPDTPQVATDLLWQPERYLTNIGGALRHSSMDELPQLFSVLCGDLGLVGPRPALFNQYELTALRTENGVHQLRPGLTGWAQVRGRDNLNTAEKAFLDHDYMKRKCWQLDVRILLMTVAKVLRRDGVAH
jgi:O-antigen biosynthesis protein WbqP